jgi:hypothetical protein
MCLSDGGNNEIVVSSHELFFFRTARASAYFIEEKEGIIQNRLGGQNKSDYSRTKSVAKPFPPAAI